MKPKYLRETTLAMCVMNMGGFVFIDPAVGSIYEQAIIFGIIIACTYVVLWFYWNGKNWARTLVLLGASLSLINILFIGSASLAGSILIMFEAAFGLLMLWWLNTTKIKSFFRGIATK
ncbi:hypothetical protein [Deefgea rivuli]|uniref:hypothetical protein n=1 Tax=Deefgea rivuli TaxID=400948 RepID=UPI000486083B|nr:hypothetical protein [Deefgea rivuli]